MSKSIAKEVMCLDHTIRKYVSHGYDQRKSLNFTQFQVVKHLLINDGKDICQKDLEELTGLKKASMTGCLNALEDKGLIMRQTAENDRRRNYIRPTEKLRAYGERIVKRSEEVDSLMMKKIDPEDLEAFFRVAERFMNNIREAEDEADL